MWQAERERAKSAEFSGQYHIFASDIDPALVELAKESAHRAGVLDDITFSQGDARTITPPAPKGVLVTNPPYGERILERREAETLYQRFGNTMRNFADWQLFILSAHADFEQSFGKKADKKRKLYHGMMKCNLFMYR